MPNRRHASVIASPSSTCATKRSLSSIAEHSLHGINTPREKLESVTHVSGTFCHLCLGPLNAIRSRRLGRGRAFDVHRTAQLRHGISKGYKVWRGLHAT